MPNETWDQSEQKICGFISGTLGIDDSSIQIERAHRLPAKTTPRPLIAKFSFYKDKDKVLKRYREIRKAERESELSGAQNDGADGAAVDSGQSLKVRVSEDFPERVRKVRALLVKFLNQALQSGKNAYLRYDKLVVNGHVYEYDYQKERPVPVSFMK